MFNSESINIMHLAVEWLLHPVIYILLFVVIATLWEVGTTVGERFGGLTKLKDCKNISHIEILARKRIERADLIARVGPMLGLMGTLIPLGPGLAALGQGELQTLASAVTVAFDTTVLGLLAGIAGFVIGRLRRRWYDHVLDELDNELTNND